MEHIFHNSLMDSDKLVSVAGRLESRQRYYGEIEPTLPGKYLFKTLPGTQLLLDFQPMAPTTSLELIVAINGQHYFAHNDLKRGVIIHPDMPMGCYPIAFEWPKSGSAGLGTMVLNNYFHRFTFSNQNRSHNQSDGICLIDFLFYKVKQNGRDNQYRANPQVYVKRHIFDYDSYLSLDTSLVKQETR